MEDANVVGILIIALFFQLVLLYLVIKAAVKAALVESGIAIKTTIKAALIELGFDKSVQTAPSVSDQQEPVKQKQPSWPAGWYAYPGSDDGHERYYDGTKWTDQRRPKQ